MVPSEIEELLVPVVSTDEEELHTLNRQFRDDEQPEEILRRQDRRILGQLGLSEEECDVLRDAWSRLRDRRQRRD